MVLGGLLCPPHDTCQALFPSPPVNLLSQLWQRECVCPGTLLAHSLEVTQIIRGDVGVMNERGVVTCDPSPCPLSLHPQLSGKMPWSFQSTAPAQVSGCQGSFLAKLAQVMPSGVSVKHTAAVALAGEEADDSTVTQNKANWLM